MRTLCAALLLAGASVCASAQEKALIVTTRSAGQVMYALSQKPTVTFTKTDVVLKTTEVEVSYPLAEHVQFTFGETGNAVDKLKDVDVVIACQADRIVVSHAVPGTAISLSAPDGRLLQTTKADASGQATLPLSGRGVYLVSVGKMTMKISNK